MYQSPINTDWLAQRETSDFGGLASMGGGSSRAWVDPSTHPSITMHAYMGGGGVVDVSGTGWDGMLGTEGQDVDKLKH